MNNFNIARPIKVLISCEHASNDLPLRFRPGLGIRQDILTSHRAYDIGALTAASYIRKALAAPLYAGKVSRLLIDLNRSLTNGSGLFSEFSKHLSTAEKQTLIDSYYTSYHNSLVEEVKANIAAGRKTLHLSVHTFTPELNGEIRPTDIGLLYDPQRKSEKLLCALLQSELRRVSGMKIHLNSPYRGVSDGVATILRRRFPESKYLGIELEINQKFYLSRLNRGVSPEKAILSALKEVLIIR